MPKSYLSYSDDPILARRMKLADAMYQGGTQTTPVRTPLEGFGRLAQALAGAWGVRKAEDEYKANQEKDIGAWEGLAESLGSGADIGTALKNTRGGTPATRAKLTQLGVDLAVKQRGKKDDALLKKEELNLRLAHDLFKEGAAPVYNEQGFLIGKKPIQGHNDIITAQEAARAAAKAQVDLQYKPQTAAATATAENPALTARHAANAATDTAQAWQRPMAVGDSVVNPSAIGIRNAQATGGLPRPSPGLVAGGAPGSVEDQPAPQPAPQPGAFAPQPPSPPGYDPAKGGLVSPGVYQAPLNRKAAVENETKQKELRTKAVSTLASLESQNKLVVEDIDKAIAIAEGSSLATGLGGKYLSDIPYTSAQDLAKRLKTITANIGFDKLQEMRQNSPTGGALGQVSDFENKQLQAVRGAMDQDQRGENLVGNLKRLKRIIMTGQQIRRDAFSQDFGGAPAYAPVQDTGVTAAGANPSNKLNTLKSKYGLE